MAKCYKIGQRDILGLTQSGDPIFNLQLCKSPSKGWRKILLEHLLGPLSQSPFTWELLLLESDQPQSMVYAVLLVDKCSCEKRENLIKLGVISTVKTRCMHLGEGVENGNGLPGILGV